MNPLLQDAEARRSGKHNVLSLAFEEVDAGVSLSNPERYNQYTGSGGGGSSSSSSSKAEEDQDAKGLSDAVNKDREGRDKSIKLKVAGGKVTDIETTKADGSKEVKTDDKSRQELAAKVRGVRATAHSASKDAGSITSSIRGARAGKAWTDASDDAVRAGSRAMSEEDHLNAAKLHSDASIKHAMASGKGGSEKHLDAENAHNAAADKHRDTANALRDARLATKIVTSPE
jgi:hypothetical protein